MLHGAIPKVSWAIHCWVCVSLLSSCAHFIIVLLLSTDMQYLDWYKVEVTGKSSANVCVSDPHTSGRLPPVSYNSTFICRKCFHVYLFVFHQPYLTLISQHPHTHTTKFFCTLCSHQWTDTPSSKSTRVVVSVNSIAIEKQIIPCSSGQVQHSMFGFN